MNKLIYILAFLSLTLTFCKKQEPSPLTVGQSLDLVTVPSGFDWKMTHTTTLHITGKAMTIVKILSIDGKEQLYKGMIPAGKTKTDITLTLPRFMNEILVNDIPVTISGTDISVSIPGLKDILLTNYYLSFDGAGDYVNLGDITELNSATAFTFEGWFNFTAVPADYNLFYKVFDSDHNVSIRTTAGDQLVVGISNGSPASGEIAVYSGVITAATWTHIAVVYDGTGVTNADRLKIYINNALQVLGFTGTIPAATSASISGVSAYLSYSSNSFNGGMDEVRIWDVARTAGSILTSYNKIIDPSTADLVAYYRFDEGSGTTAEDLASAYDGTITGAVYALYSNGWDSDGDGVNDLTDDYPLDPLRAFDNYFPVSGTGTLAFEDLWPSWGDYDFNDLILDYRFQTVTDASNEVVEIFGTFKVRANGAKLHNGFGFELPDAVAGIATGVVVTGYSHTQGIITVDGTSFFETGQTNPVVIAFDDTWDLMPGIANTVPGGATASFDSVVVTMTVTGGPFVAGDFSLNTWNPFLFIDLERGREVHLIDYPPTDLMTTSYFGTKDDASDPGNSIYYQTNTGFPWGMDFPVEYEYTAEYREPSIAYLHFIEWIQSGGVLYPDWYSNTGPGYRNTSYIYAP